MAEPDHIQNLLQSLGKAVIQAMSRSDDVTSVVRKIRDEGFTLFLVLDDKDRGDRCAQIELRPREVPRQLPAGEPAFRLGGADVALLKSLGIDATRPAGRRRG